MGENVADLKTTARSVQQMLHAALEAYANEDVEAARKVLEQDAAIDAFYGQFIRKVAAQASRSPEMMGTHLDVLSIAKNFERIADHTTNVAEDVIFLRTGEIVRHHPK